MYKNKYMIHIHVVQVYISQLLEINKLSWKRMYKLS